MWDLNGRNAMAASATLHCLTGCALGEVLGLLIGTALGLSNGATIGLAIGLAFLFGYALSTLPLVSAGVPLRAALSVVLAADTLSIAVMEVVDNVVMALVPGAMDAGLVNVVFWLSMMLALTAAFFAAFPVNRYLIDRGKGHALTHRFHIGHQTGHDTGHQTGHDAESVAQHSAAPAQAVTHPGERKEPAMNTKTIAAALAGFMLGGLLVSVAAQLDEAEAPEHTGDLTAPTH